jgi:hypothetical protein
MSFDSDDTWLSEVDEEEAGMENASADNAAAEEKDKWSPVRRRKEEEMLREEDDEDEQQDSHESMYVFLFVLVFMTWLTFCLLGLLAQRV